MTRPKDVNAPSRWNMRIWDDDKHEWLCQSDEDALTYYGFAITGGETTEFQGLPKWHPSRHYIWEQSTGLKDTNGKEIYEGDIISFENEKGLAKVLWLNNKAMFGLKWLDCGVSDELDYWIVCKGPVGVIGNTHENPELLEGQNDN